MGSLDNGLPYIQSLVEDLRSEVEFAVDIDVSSRAKALDIVKKLTYALESPKNAISQSILLPNVLSCVKIALDLDLFNVLGQSKDKPKTAAELAHISGAETQLIVRIMRNLTATGFANEVGKNTYSWNSKTEAMRKPGGFAGMTNAFNASLPLAVKAPDFFKSNGYKNPTNTGQSPFQFCMNTEATYFEWFQQRPEYMKTFNTLMQGIRADREFWVDWFPIQEHLLDGVSKEANDILMVDVGGNRGHDLMGFHDKFPAAPGKLVLQDQPHVIDDPHSTVTADVEKVKYDFFTPQPLKGARLYFMHFILHNWDDDQAVQILKNQASAMKSGYSKLLLNEWILSDVGCSLYDATMDIQMMLGFSGMLRTRTQWQELLQRAGLKLEKFWLSPGFGEGIVEATI